MPLSSNSNFKISHSRKIKSIKELLAVLNKKMKHKLWLKELLNQSSDSYHSLISKKISTVEMPLLHCTKKVVTVLKSITED